MQGNFQHIIQSDIPVLVDFYADWCGPCKMMPPILKQVKETLGESIRIIKINVDHNPEIAGRFGIQSIPTSAIFQKGELKWRSAGVMQSGQLIQAVQKNCQINL